MPHPLQFAAILTLVLSTFSPAADLNHPAQFHPDYTSKEQWSKRAQELREQVLVAAGLWPMPAKSDLHPVIHGRIDRDEYTVEKVYFESLPGFFVTGNLYRPKTPGPHPAVLSPYGHWPGGRFQRADHPEKQIDLGAEKTIESATYPLQARCATLARLGCVVFHYDMVGYGDCLQIPHREGFTDPDALLRLQSTLGLQLWNSIRSLDFLLALPDVDPKRVGVTGASGGATQTLLLAVVDPRPTAIFPAVMISEDMQGGCVCENAPCLRIGTNNAELAATLAPRPLGMSAANDWTKDLETRGYPEIKSIYKLYNAEQNVTAKHFPFEHNYNQPAREMMYDFMNQYLKLGHTSPIHEQPFAPIPPEQLSVFDSAHPKPTTGDAASVRKWMRETSDHALADLKYKHPADHRQILLTALHVMIRDRHAATTQPAPEILRPKNQWNGEVVIFAKDSSTTSAGAQALLNAGFTVISPHASTVTPLVPDPKYAGFTFGYNPSPIAQRVNDVLAALDTAKNVCGVHHIHLVARERMAPAAVIVRALATTPVEKTSIDLATFSFSDTRPADEDFLPGILKYGDSLLSLLDPDTTTIHQGSALSEDDMVRQFISSTIPHP